MVSELWLFCRKGWREKRIGYKSPKNLTKWERCKPRNFDWQKSSRIHPPLRLQPIYLLNSGAKL